MIAALLNPATFHNLVSGRRGGPAAALARFALWLAEGPYTLAVRWRNRRYDRGRAEVRRAGVPVVSVGNLTLGGTGKTPMVEWLARWFLGRGVRVAIVSRGYGAEAGSQNDEALALEQVLPDVPHLQDPDRAAAARIAVEEFDCQLIVLDDGFQHRRLARDLDLVMIDALEPFGFGHVFPRGTLREPLAGLRRARVVVLSRADLVEPERRREIEREVRRYTPDAVWAEARHVPLSLRSADGHEEPLEHLRGQPVAAFSGIGNPAGFRRTLDDCGFRTVAFREFPDHHAYARADIESLGAWLRGLEEERGTGSEPTSGVARANTGRGEAPVPLSSRRVRAVVCTHKDLVKVKLDRLAGVPLRAVRIGLDFLSGEEQLAEKLTTCVPSRVPLPGRCRPQP